jgi:hypothetical protein
MAARLPSVFGDGDDDDSGFMTPTRVTASGFTSEAMGQSYHANQRFAPNQQQQFRHPQQPLRNPFSETSTNRLDNDYSEVKQEQRNDFNDIAAVLRQMNEKMESLESEVRASRADSAYDDGGTQITQKIRGLNRDNRTIAPMDSVSNVMPASLTTAKIRDNEIFQKSVSSRQECLYDSVVGGFAQTPEEKMEELEALTKIRTIYGLPKIFNNERLNFLIHIHKPLSRLLSNGAEYPSQDTLHRIDDFMKRKANKVRTQHEDLLYSVIETTVRKGRIRSNPHNLPILEVGMSLTDKIAYICFASLYREFQTEWFQSMKDIEAPQFHNTYSNFKSDRAIMPQKEKSSRRPAGYKRSSAGGSVISFLRD